MKGKNKKLKKIIIALIVLLMVVSGTLAWLITSDFKKGKLGAGNLDITVQKVVMPTGDQTGDADGFVIASDDFDVNDDNHTADVHFDDSGKMYPISQTNYKAIRNIETKYIRINNNSSSDAIISIGARFTSAPADSDKVNIVLAAPDADENYDGDLLVANAAPEFAKAMVDEIDTVDNFKAYGAFQVTSQYTGATVDSTGIYKFNDDFYLSSVGFTQGQQELLNTIIAGEEDSGLPVETTGSNKGMYRFVLDPNTQQITNMPASKKDIVYADADVADSKNIYPTIAELPDDVNAAALVEAGFISKTFKDVEPDANDSDANVIPFVLRAHTSVVVPFKVFLNENYVNIEDEENPVYSYDIVVSGRNYNIGDIPQFETTDDASLDAVIETLKSRDTLAITIINLYGKYLFNLADLYETMSYKQQEITRADVITQAEKDVAEKGGDSTDLDAIINELKNKANLINNAINNPDNADLQAEVRAYFKDLEDTSKELTEIVYDEDGNYRLAEAIVAYCNAAKASLDDMIYLAEDQVIERYYKGNGGDYVKLLADKAEYEKVRAQVKEIITSDLDSYLTAEEYATLSGDAAYYQALDNLQTDADVKYWNTFMGQAEGKLSGFAQLINKITNFFGLGSLFKAGTVQKEAGESSTAVVEEETAAKIKNLLVQYIIVSKFPDKADDEVLVKAVEDTIMSEDIATIHALLGAKADGETDKEAADREIKALNDALAGIESAAEAYDDGNNEEYSKILATIGEKLNLGEEFVTKHVAKLDDGGEVVVDDYTAVSNLLSDTFDNLIEDGYLENENVINKKDDIIEYVLTNYYESGITIGDYTYDLETLCGADNTEKLVELFESTYNALTSEAPLKK